MFLNLDTENFKDVLRNAKETSMEDAIFRNNESFTPANLRNYLPFWEHEILKYHPHKETILKWLQGVQIKEFLNSYTSGSLQGIQ